jgi:hypothetical protein
MVQMNQKLVLVFVTVSFVIFGPFCPALDCTFEMIYLLCDLEVQHTEEYMQKN